MASSGRLPVGSSDASSVRPSQSFRRVVARLLDRYPELPPPLEGTGARVAFWVVVGCAVLWTLFYSIYLWAVHDAYLTHAEDMATMAQALWNTTHGAFLRDTVCNIISDTNCLGDVSRFAIHFEPIMLPLAALYALIPTPKLLQFVQAAVVASGALPVYWLASRRLRSALLGVAFALLYLLYPPLQSAVTYDFHAVTLSAAFLMFALYFMFARNDVGLLIACVLAMATKEEVPVDVLLIGLSIGLFQRRWKVGGGVMALSAVWLIVELLIMRAASPLGHSPTAARYGALGSSPIQVALTLLTHPAMVVRDYVLSHDGMYYLRTLLSPLGYLPVLSPWALLIAGPALAINLLSSDPSMRAGIYHYNAEIAPVLIFAAVDAVVWVSAAAGWLARVARPRLVALGGLRLGAWSGLLARWPVARVALLGLTLLALLFGLYEQRLHGDSALAEGFTWPAYTAHTQLADRFIAMIPPNASVSAQSDLAPHLSNRRYLYLFPYQMAQADYVALDVTGNIYPFMMRSDYAQYVKALLADKDYHVVAAQDGYLLFKRGAGPALSSVDPQGLPESFYSFTMVGEGPRPVSHPAPVRFGSALRMTGYSISPAPTLYLNNPYLHVTTYWETLAPLQSNVTSEQPNGMHLELVLKSAGGAETTYTDFATTEWRQMETWRPGVIYAVDSGPLLLTSALGSQIDIGVRILQGPPDDTLAPPLLAQVSDQGSHIGPVTVEDSGSLAVFAHETIAK